MDSSETHKNEEDELDAILDQAIEEFDTEVAVTPVKQAPTPNIDSIDTKGFSEKESEEFMKAMQDFWKEVGSNENEDQELNNEQQETFLREVQEIFQQVMSQSTAGPQSSTTTTTTSSASPSPTTTTSTTSTTSTQETEDNSELSEFEKNLANTLKMVSESAQRLEENQAQGGQEDMDAMAEAFSKMFGNVDDSGLENMLENMVKQFMNKDVIYAPLQSACSKYPQWLQENQHNPEITEEQMNNYRKQYDILQQLLAVYDTTPDEFDKILGLMEEVGKCGSPPQKLIEELASGDEPMNFPGMGDPSKCPVM